MTISPIVKNSYSTNKNTNHINSDKNGMEFEQTINVNDVNPQCATIVEMRALEAVSSAPKMNGFSSLPIGLTNVGLNERQDFILGFKNEIADMQTLGQYALAREYERMLRQHS